VLALAGLLGGCSGLPATGTPPPEDSLAADRATAPGAQVAAAPATEGESLIFGAEPAPIPPEMPAEDEPQRMFGLQFELLRVELGRLLESDQSVDGSHYLHGTLGGEWALNDRWEVRLAGRVDGFVQTGEPDFTDLQADYDESFVRYRSEHHRVTVGTQKVFWGRVDEIPPVDRLSVQDLRRFILDDLPDRRLAVGTVRWESFFGGFKADALFVPKFRAAELPDQDSIWSPVDRERGRIIGFEADPVLRTLVRNGRFAKDTDGAGGGGVRLSWIQENLDYSVTLQRARHSPPYYELSDSLRRQLLAGEDALTALARSPGITFTEKHPWTWVAGGDLVREALDAIWRLEAVYLSDFPATTEELEFTTKPALDWVAGVEFFPGDGDTQINLQLAGHHLFNASSVVDRTSSYLFNGRYETTFANQRWRIRLRFFVGLDAYDLYLNPQLAYLGWEPHQIYLGTHLFDGAENTLSGFHKDHSLITLGWRVEF